jgi:hypothetical protein
VYEGLPINNYKKEYDIDTGGSYEDYYPINTHLCIEYSTYLYFVPFQNTLVIVELDTSDGTITLIATETNAITKFYHDRANDLLYYYHGQSTFSYLDLTNVGAGPTDLDDTLDAIEDLFVYDGDLFAIDTSEDDLTYYKYTPGSPGTWGAVGTIAEGKTNIYNIGALGNNDDPWGITWDGSNFFVTDSVDDIVYKYNAALDTKIAEYDISGTVTRPNAICWDGTYFYILKDTSPIVYVFNSSFVFQTSYDLSTLGGNTVASGICFDGTYIWTSDYVKNNAYKYPTNFSSLLDTVALDSGNTVSRCLEWDGNFFYVVDDLVNKVFKYSSDFSTLISVYELGSLGGNDYQVGICWDGYYFFIVDGDAPEVYQYNSELKTDIGLVTYVALISNNAYVIYQYPTGQCKIYVKDLDANEPIAAPLETLTSGLKIPYSENQRGLAVSSDDDTLSFVLEDTSDGKTYFCTYVISTDTFTKGGEFNVAIMLNRNSNESNAIPFNTEKAFGMESGVNDLMVFQIIERGSASNRIVKIADLNNLTVGTTVNYTSGYVIKAITDTYLIIYNNSTGASELWKLQSMDSAVISAVISHEQRDYPTARLQYDSGKLNLTEGMHIQFIGTFKGVADQIQFEGYVTFPEDNKIEDPRLKDCNLVNRLADDFCNNFYSGTQDAARTDQHLNNIITAKNNYVSNGTQSNGSNISETPYRGNVELRILTNHLASFDKFTWYSSPTGAIDFDNGAVDSGVNYADNVAPKIFDVTLFKRDKVYNEIEIEGAYVNGAKVTSTTNGTNPKSQDEYGIQYKKIMIPSGQTAADCNTWAQAICDLLSSSLTIVEFTVLDTTNGMLQPGEEITLTLANNSYRTITAAQYKIQSVEFNNRTGVATYVAASSVYYEYHEFESLIDTNAENINQLSVYSTEEGGLITKTGWDPSAVLALSFSDSSPDRTFTITPTGTATYYINNAMYPINVADTVQIDDTEGVWYIYYAGSVLTASQTPWVIKNDSVCMVTQFYWDATNNKHFLLGKETHGWKMDGATHNRLHDIDGSGLESGGTLSDFDVDGSGNDNTNAQFQNDATEIHDEDIEISHALRAKGVNLTKIYRDGADASNIWRVDEDDPYPLVHTGNVGEIRAAWNQLSGGTWSLVEVSDNQFVLAHIFVNTDTTRRYHCVIGQAEYATKNAARSGARTELIDIRDAGLPTPEFVAIATVIIQTKDSYSNTPSSKLVSVNVDGDEYISWLDDPIGRTGTTSHPRLHLITSQSDHEGGTWKVVYTNGSGVVTELALGAANEVLTSNGAAAAPTFENPHSNYILLENRQNSGTSGGTVTSGAWRTSTLNQEVLDEPAACSLAANVFTLAAGTYEIEAIHPFYNCNSAQIRLYNQTDTSVVHEGQTVYVATTDAVQISATLKYKFTIAASKALRIEYQVSSTQATNGQGVAASFGTEVYLIVRLRKTA